jgi:ribonucleotide reductase beta subunit family protein with ferritin-like domain
MILIHFIKNRVNTKLGDLGYKPIIDDVDMNAVGRMKWFDHYQQENNTQTFFANRVTNYSKGHMSGMKVFFNYG